MFARPWYLWEDSTLIFVINRLGENAMSRTLNATLPVILFISALALSACATKPEAVPAAAPAPVEAAVQEPAAPQPEAEAEAVTAPAPVEVEAESSFAPPPAPEPIAPKPRKRVAKRSAPPMPPAPVIAEAPIVEPEAPAALPVESKPPVIVAPQKQEIQEEGFLEKYWLWLVGLAVVIAGIVVWWRKGGEVEG